MAQFSLASIKRDMNKVENGTTVQIGDGFEVTVRRIGCPQYREYVNAKIKPHQAMADKLRKDVDQKIWESIANEALVETILLGWSGLVDENGVEVPYTKEKAKELLTDPAYGALKEIISTAASEEENYRDVATATTVAK